jgi:nucleoid DNA-binding protein
MYTAPHNVTRAHLLELTRERTGLSGKETRNVLETILQNVEDRLRAGERVKIFRFGTLTVKRSTRDVGATWPVERRHAAVAAEEMARNACSELIGCGIFSPGEHTKPLRSKA